MLALETSDTWTTGTIAVQVGSTGPYTYTLVGRDAYSEMVSFVAWCNTRAWAPGFTWSWARNATDGGGTLTLYAHTTCSLTCNAQATALLGFVTAGAAVSHTGSTSAVGTWAPTIRIAVNKHVRLLGDGDAGGSNLVRPGVPGLAGLRPTVEALGNVIDACRVAHILATASTPRRCWVYQTHKTTWRNYALGNVSRSAQDTTAYRFSLEVAGEAL